MLVLHQFAGKQKALAPVTYQSVRGALQLGTQAKVRRLSKKRLVRLDTLAVVFRQKIRSSRQLDLHVVRPFFVRSRCQ